MPRRDRDPRPPIEILGEEAPEAPVRQVVVGRASGVGRDRRRWPVVGAVVVALAAGMAIGSQDDDQPERRGRPTTSRHDRSTTTTVVQELPDSIGPVLPVATGASVLLGDDGRDRWALLDLDTGELRELDLAIRDDQEAMLPVAGGIVLTSPTAVMFVPLVAGGEPVLLAGGSEAGAEVIPSSRPDHVWLVRPPLDASGAATFHLVDLTGRELAVRSHAVPYAVAAVDEGPLVAQGGRVYVLGAEGPRLLGIGDLYGGAGDHVVIVACDERARCGPGVVAVSTGRAVRPAPRVGALGTGFLTTFVPSEDGQLLELDYEGDGPTVRWFDATGRLVATGSPQGDRYIANPMFLPEGQGLLWRSGPHELEILTPASDGTLAARSVELPDQLSVDQVVLISR